MNPKTTAILLIVFVLGIVALLLVRGTGQKPADTNPSDTADGLDDQPLIGGELLATSLSVIEIAPQALGKERPSTVVIALVNGRWMLTAPYRFPANPAAIDELLSILAALRGTPTAAGAGRAESSDRAGANGDRERPGIRLTRDGRDGHAQSYRLLLGERRGAGRAMIERITPSGKATVYNAQDSLHDLLENFDPSALYAKEIDPPLMPEVERIQVTRPEGSSVLTQRDGRWWIGDGADAERALEDQLEQQPGVSTYFKLISKLELAEPQRYAGVDGLAKFGLADPLIRARFVPFDDADNSGASGLELRVGVPADPLDEQRYIAIGGLDAARPAVFKAPTPIALALGVDATAFRDPRVIATPASLIESIDLKGHITFGEGPELVRESIVFSREGPPVLTTRDGEQQTLSRKKCARMVIRLVNARAREVVPLEADKWSLQTAVAVQSTLGGEPEVFSVYTAPQAEPDDTVDDGTVYYVHRGTEPVALEVERSAVEDLFRPLDLVGRE